MRKENFRPASIPKRLLTKAFGVAVLSVSLTCDMEFMDGLRPAGEMQPAPEASPPTEPFEYLGYYRVGPRIVFSYRIGETAYLDSPWATEGKFERVVAPAKEHPLFTQIENAPTQWPETVTTSGTLGEGEGPYVVDTIRLPFDNPYDSLLFIGDHDFLPDGRAVLTTMTGDIWLVSGLDDSLEKVVWKKFAGGLHQPLGLVVHENNIYVLGRDQITRLVDLNKRR